MRALIATVLALTLIAAAPLQSFGFGDRVAQVVNQPSLSADFDGDGVPDTVSVVSVARGGVLPDDVAVISTFWGSVWRAGKGAKLALAIVVGKQHRKFLIADPGYFGSPIWSGRQLPLDIAKRGSKAFKEFQSQEHRIQHDILVLGTEAGIDTALYWNGKTFAFFQPAEEP